jgi:hypothetical protein
MGGKLLDSAAKLRVLLIVAVEDTVPVISQVVVLNDSPNPVKTVAGSAISELGVKAQLVVNPMELTLG